VAVTLLDFERSGIDYAAASRRLLDDLWGYVRENQGLGRVDEEWVGELLAERYVEVEVARRIAYRVAWMQSRELVPTMEASMSKVFGSETLQRVADTGHKILGLYGSLTREDKWAPLEGLVQEVWRHSFSSTIVAGTSEIQRNIIASRGLGMPRG
jgi:alkylation response protein AidB-like acyl-CoA dehydrogenase